MNLYANNVHRDLRGLIDGQDCDIDAILALLASPHLAHLIKHAEGDAVRSWVAGAVQHMATSSRNAQANWRRAGLRTALVFVQSIIDRPDIAATTD